MGDQLADGFHPGNGVRPSRHEATDYWFGYIDQAPDGDICDTLRRQQDDALRLLETIDEARSTYRYADGKWSIRELLAHINDCERLFVFRAFWFARGFDSELPSFDDKVASAGAESDRAGWAHHLGEFDAVRSGTIAFLEGLPPAAWDRTGTASGARFTVRALAWITAGHAAHHLKVLSTRYFVSSAARSGLPHRV